MDNPFLSPLPLPVNQGLHNTDHLSVSDHAVIYPFIQRLEGYKTNLKGHHWHGYNNSTHVRIDEFFDEVGEAQDAIAETASGVYGIMRLGFTGIPSNNWEILPLCRNIINDFIFVNKQLEPEAQNLGVLNQIQDSIQKLNAIYYFIELSLKGIN
jgi:hypothetical protein